MNKLAIVVLALVWLAVLSVPLQAAVPVCTWGFDTAPAVVPVTVERACGATVGDYFYFIGGEDTSAYYPDVFAYSPIADAWETRAPLPEARSNACAAAIGAKIYVVGGCTDSPADTLFIYDTAADAWSEGAAYPMVIEKPYCAAVDGLLYVAGGYSGGVMVAGYVYDPGADSWTAIPDMPAPREYGRGVAYQGYFYAVGGFDDATLYRYDPNGASWTTMAPAPVNMACPNMITPEYPESSFFWAFGSGLEWTPDGTIRAYSTSGDTWSVAADFGTLPLPVVDAVSDNFHDAVFIMAGGFGSDGEIDWMQVFRYCAPYPGPLTPDTVGNDADTAVTISGLNFDDSVASDYYLEGSTKERVDFLDLVVVDGKTITATVPAGLETGEYTLWVTNGFTEVPTKSRSAALTVEAPWPEVAGIDPDKGQPGATVGVTITGDHFFGAPAVKLMGPVNTEINATNVVVTDVNTISCDFDLTGAATGDYDVVVSTENGEGTLVAGFSVNESAGDDDANDDINDDDSAGDDDNDDSGDDDDGCCGC